MLYRIKGLGVDGAMLRLSLNAGSIQEASDQATAQGVAVLSVHAEWQWAWWKDVFRTKFPLLLFCQELLALLNAGIHLIEAVETLAEKERRPELKKILIRISGCLREGKTLSAALEQVPDAFPPLIRATVRASERTGGLAEALVRYIVYETQIDSVRKKLISATIYPITLMMAGLLVLVFLLGYVVPRFSQVYADMGGSLPWLTRILLEWGQLIDRHGMVVLAAAVVSAVFAWRWLRSPASRRQLAAWLWRVPAIGTYVHTHQLARFYRTLGMLLRGGVAVAHALRMVDGLLSPGMQSRLHGAQTMIHDGRSISEAMETHGLVTPVALRMLRVGERSGRMGEMMEKIAEFHDEETARRLDWFAKLFEPLLMAVIGIVIGVIVLLMYLPIFEIAGNIQ